MKKEFTPIAMRCTEEQFEAIKPKLEGLEIGYIDDFKSYIYLTNNSGNIPKLITNVANAGLSYGNREFYEEWNEKVFLEACGISTVPTLEEVKEYFKDAEKFKNCDGHEGSFLNADERGIHLWCGMYWIHDKFNQNVWLLWDSKGGYAEILTYKEKTYSLTKEQLKSLTDPQVKEWFPEFFETVLEIGKWYKKTWIDGDIDLFHVYSFNEDGSINDKGQYWRNGKCNYWGKKNRLSRDERFNLSEATESEVFEALKNEAVKRGYSGNNVFIKLFDKEYQLLKEEGKYSMAFNSNIFFYQGATIFKDGIWAEIIPSITRKEAENKLGVKIVD